MDVLAEKMELVRRLLDTNDLDLIEEVKRLFEKREQDFWNELPDHVKNGINRGKDQAHNGNVTAHSTVMDKYSRYL